MLVAVVLGNRMNDDGTPTELMLKRMQLTLEMYVRFNPDKIILSGGLANKKAGITDRIPEKLIDAASAVSGCGPAFVYLFIEALSDGGVLCGLPRDKALLYAAETVN